MQYINGAEVTPYGKDLKIQRYTNKKWYSGKELLIQIKKQIENSESSKLRHQFVMEYLEIKKLFYTFSVSLGKGYNLKLKHSEGLIIKNYN